MIRHRGCQIPRSESVSERVEPTCYPGQRILVVDVGGYAVLVPFIEDDRDVFLKTIIPSRKATRDYLGE